MKTLFLIIAIMLLTSPVYANQTHSEVSHSFELQVSGEWKLETSTQTPSVNHDVSLEGVGDAWMKYDFYILQTVTPVNVWWDLF